MPTPPAKIDWSPASPRSGAMDLPALDAFPTDAVEMVASALLANLGERALTECKVRWVEALAADSQATAIFWWRVMRRCGTRDC